MTPCQGIAYSLDYCKSSGASGKLASDFLGIADLQCRVSSRGVHQAKPLINREFYYGGAIDSRLSSRGSCRDFSLGVVEPHCNWIYLDLRDFSVAIIYRVFLTNRPQQHKGKAGKKTIGTNYPLCKGSACRNRGHQPRTATSGGPFTTAHITKRFAAENHYYNKILILKRMKLNLGIKVTQ